MAHQWFGNLTTPQWWDDLWLNESFAEYMGNRVTADVTEYGDAWTQTSYARRQWGLLADQRPSTHPVAGNGAEDATAALQDFDGISYAKGSSILKQLNASMGDEVFFAGVRRPLRAPPLRQRHDARPARQLDPGRSRRPGVLRRQLAGHGRARPDRPGAPGHGACARPRPGTPPQRGHTMRVATRAADEAAWQVGELARGRRPGAVRRRGGDRRAPGPLRGHLGADRAGPETLALLPSLAGDTEDPLLRAGMWNSVRSAYHHARVAPAVVLDLLEAGLPAEDQDSAVQYTLAWVLAKVVPARGGPRGGRPTGARREPAGRPRRRARFHPPAGGYQAAVSSCGSVERLEGWLMGRDLPDGVALDLALRWRILVRLAVLGALDRSALDAHLEAEATAVSRVEHTRAVASLPTAEAKAWAWERFSGATSAPNYELEAAGEGMWRTGQEALTDPYVARYFDELPGTAQVHSGWVLADVAEAFFPLTSLRPETVERAHALAASAGLDVSLRRRVVDTADELEHRLAVVRTFGGGAWAG